MTSEPCYLDTIGGILQTEFANNDVDIPVVYGTRPEDKSLFVSVYPLTSNRDHCYGDDYIPQHEFKLIIRANDVNTVFQLAESVTDTLEKYPQIRLVTSGDPIPVTGGDIISSEITSIYKIIGDM